MRAMRVVMILGCALALPVAAQQGPMRDGRWEITGQMEMPGMKMPETKTTQCITKEQLKDPASTVAGLGANDKSCKASDYKVNGNTVTWKMACTGAQAMTGDGEMTFSGDSYTGKMTMTMAQGSMTMKTAGKRVGDCTQ